MKMEIPLNRANRVINHGPVLLVTSKYKEAVNIITISWATPISHKPPLVGISVAKGRYSHGLISKSKEFVVNVPHEGMLREIDYCGSVSGRNEDKLKNSSLTPEPAKKVGPPLIKECIGHLECKVVSSHDIGDHTFFVGEVLAASAQEGLFDKTWRPEAKTLHHLGGDSYMVAGLHKSP